MSERRHRETAKHHDAFEAWYAAERNSQQTSSKLGIPNGTLRTWVEWFGWHERADKRDKEAAAKADRDAVQRRAAMFKRHRENAELMQGRGREYFRDNKIERAADAINAIVKGVDQERQSEGLPDWVIEILNADEDSLRKRAADLDGRRREAMAGGPQPVGELLSSNGKH